MKFRAFGITALATSLFGATPAFGQSTICIGNVCESGSGSMSINGPFRLRSDGNSTTINGHEIHPDNQNPLTNPGWRPSPSGIQKPRARSGVPSIIDYSNDLGIPGRATTRLKDLQSAPPLRSGFGSRLSAYNPIKRPLRAYFLPNATGGQNAAICDFSDQKNRITLEGIPVERFVFQSIEDLKATQRMIGTTPDGICGDKTKIGLTQEVAERKNINVSFDNKTGIYYFAPR